MKTQQGGTRPKVGDLFELAEAVGVFYGTKGADAATEEFRDVAQEYRHQARREGQVAWLTYVLRLLLSCPVLLQRPSGLAWVTEDLQWALRHRKVRSDVDRDFWAAVRQVRGLLTRGRPGDKALDFFRYEMVHGLLSPVTTDPALGVVGTKKLLGKTKAVTALAALEAGWSRRRPDVREIWRSLQRVEDYYERLQAQLAIARTKQAARAGKRSQ